MRILPYIRAARVVTLGARVTLATLLIRAGCRVITGWGDSRVLLNTQRLPRIADGQIKPFISRGDAAVSFPPDFRHGRSLGVPVPSRAATLAGYRVEEL